MLFTLAAGVAMVSFTALGVDRSWSGGTASYTNAANWTGGVVPGASDTAINNNGTNNAVQVNVGDPDWTVGQIVAGSAGSGAFEQNGQTVTVPPNVRGIRLGAAPADTGVYTLNDGSLVYSNAVFAVGEVGTGILTVNGGSLSGNSTLAINIGSSLATANATMDGGFAKTGHTWFEQGFYTTDPSIGLPPAGSTFVAVSNATHSYTMAPSYTADNVVMIYSNQTSGTMTFTTPTAYSGLSFLGSAGNGAVTVNYTVHHADTTTETGSIAVLDWFPPTADRTNLAIVARGRVLADGTGIQIIADNPSALSMDVVLTNTTSAVTSVDLSYVSGTGVASFMAISGSTGGNFDPITITGYNADMIVEPVTQVDPGITDYLNQTAGSINVNAEMWIGNGGNGVYNLSGGTSTVQSWFAVGRSGGDGVINMSGGELNKIGGGNLLVGSGFQSPIGGTPSGTIYHSGGTINCSSGEFLVPENSPATGSYNMSGTAVLNVNNWLAVGRNGGAGELNLTNGIITKTGGGNIVIGASAAGTLNQFGGVISNTASATWLSEGSSSSFGTWNMNGGSAVLGLLRIAQSGNVQAFMNLNGGDLTVSEISGNTSSFSQLNLNGGTIRASGNNASFLHDLTLLNLGAGGVTFDSQNFDITVAQSLTDAGSGGLTKLGTGTLAFTGNTAHSGPTVISAGKLAVISSSTLFAGNGSFTLADGTELAVDVQSLDAQMPMTSFDLGTSTGTTLELNMGLFGNNSLAPIAVSGTLTASGSNTINIPAGAFTVGTVPLISYGGFSGGGVFATGTLPLGVAGFVTNNAGTSAIELVITEAAAPRWDGAVNGDWDINATSNWVDIATANPAVFQNGNPVVFNDAAAGTTAVNVAVDVQPSSMTFTNDTLSYSLSGSGKIVGTSGLLKQGAASLAIGNANSFTGPVTIQGGTLSVSNIANGGVDSALGASSSSAVSLVIGAGTFSYAGPAAAVDRGFTLQSASSTINTIGDLSLSGPVAVGASGRFQKSGTGLLTYAGGGSNLITGNVNPGLHVMEGPMLFNGPLAGQTNSVQNDMYVGGVPDVPASLTLSNSTVLLGAWLGVGRGNGTSGVTSSLALHNSTISANGVSIGWWNNIVGNSAVQTVTLTGSSTITNRGGNTSNIGESGGSTTTLNILDNSVFGTQSRLTIASGGEAGAGTGTVMVAQSGKLLVNSFMSIGNGNLRVATLNVKDNGLVNVATDFNVSDTGSSTGHMILQDNGVVSGNTVFIGKASGTLGTVTQSGGSFTARGNYRIADSGGSTGTINMSGGSVFVGNEFWVGEDGLGNWTQTGGDVTSTNWVAIGRNGSGVGNYTISGGTFREINAGARMIVGANGAGTLTISNTAQVSSVGQFQIAEGGASTGTVNLDGGSLTVPRAYGGGGNDTFNFNGGTLVARPGAVLDFMSGLNAANVKSGGAIIDSGTNVVAINQALLDAGGGGGLTKLGTGTLYLNGANTYTGPTLVSAGALGGTGTIAGSVTVGAAGTLAPGASVGTLTIGGDLNIGGNVAVELGTNGNDLVNVTGGLTNTASGTVSVSLLGTNVTAGNIYTLFNKPVVNGNLFAVTGSSVTWSNNLAVDGSIIALSSSVSTTPVPIVSSFSGGILDLSWPADHTGWRLEVQTNLLSVGISTNWFTWPDSASTNAVSIPVDASNPTVFFRLVYP